MDAKKSYGQHFLKSESTAEKIANSLQHAEQTGIVIEVGPGMGMLTKYLAKNRPYTLYAVEADADMVNVLHRSLPDLKEHIIFQDFLKFNPNLYIEDKPFCLIGNFPYNISTQILFWMIDFRARIPEMVGMFQKEVADRVVAPPGSKTYGITSVLLQAHYDMEYLFTLEPGAFNPPPKVRSAVIRLTRKQNFKLDCNEKLFKQIVKNAFGQRRKMLRNTLKTFFPQTYLMENPDFQKRPEMLSWQEFVALTQLCERMREGDPNADSTD